MASLISKRAQARNEKALQELISSVAGNAQCADCGARNPGWASWSLGIFLCVRCASLHRKLGTHISKVKSLSMDSWNVEQVETMKRVGNTTSNRTFNPRNVKPSLPVDVDEADGVMERFIRQKYEQRAFISGAQPAKLRAGSTSSDDGHRPPLPPKPGKKFGFSLRSTSSAIPHRDREKFTPPLSPTFMGSNGSSSPAKANKQSRVLGSTVGNQSDDFDAKLATLRDMGFKDTRRNSTILKSSGGNLDRTVEALVRIGEGSKPPSGTITPVSADNATNGLTVEKRRPTEGTMGNPFDALDQQPSQRSATMPVQQPVSATSTTPQQGVHQDYDGYHQHQSHYASQNPISLQTGFQNLQLAQTDQYSVAGPSISASNPFIAHQQTQQPHYPQPMSPFSPQQSSHLQQPESSNPFLRRVQSQTFQPNPWAQQPASQLTQSPISNPWASQQQQFVQSPQAQLHMGFPQNQDGLFAPNQQPAESHQSPVYGGNNPFNNQPTVSQPSTPANYSNQAFPAPSGPLSSPYNLQSLQPSQPAFPPPQLSPQPQPQAQQYFPQQQQTHPPLSQSPAPAPFRHDKSSILALYNQPHLAPSQPLGPLSDNSAQQQQFAPQRSVTMPPAVSMAGGNMNPFTSAPQQTTSMNQQQQQQAVGGAAQQDAFSWLNQR